MRDVRVGMHGREGLHRRNMHMPHRTNRLRRNVQEHANRQHELRDVREGVRDGFVGLR